jgi:hypothetical protein
VISVEYREEHGGTCGFEAKTTVVPARPIDIASRVASLCGLVSGLDPRRRLMRRAAIRLEVMAQLQLSRSRPRRGLTVLAATGMEHSDRVGLSHRLGVGFARFVAEKSPVGLVDLYHLDGLGHEKGTPVAIGHAGSKRRPDFLGSNSFGEWFVLEAKGRGTPAPEPRVVAGAVKQTRAVSLIGVEGKPVPIAARLASVAALAASPVKVLLVDPPAEVPQTRYTVDLDWLVWAYYQEVRDSIQLGAEEGPLPASAGRLGFVSLRTPGMPIELVVHRKILESLESVEGLLGARRELAAGGRELRQTAIDEDPRLSVGLDGLGVFVSDVGGVEWAAGED